MQPQTNPWQTLGNKLRELIPVKPDATDDMQVLVLRLAVKDAERVMDRDLRSTSNG